MKKILIAVLFIGIALLNVSHARTIKITQSGSGEGYTVTEVHEDGGWFTRAKSTLTCVAPGPAACAWNINPISLPDMIGPNGSNPDWEDLYGHAEDEINSQNYSGSFVNNLLINGDFWFRNVTWNATGINNFQIEIDIQLAQ